MRKSEVSSDDSSCGLLISVIRTLTTSHSQDQKLIEKSRLEAGFEKSGARVEYLLTSQSNEISNALKTFRGVSSEITNCRQRIHAVKNALATSKVLLQCRRDDLKKLWVENVEQKCVSNILLQIEDVKQMNVNFDEYLKAQNYKQAVNILKKADIILNGPLSGVEGLDQLRSNATDLTGTLFEVVVSELLELLAVHPFESQMLELLKGMPIDTLNESVICLQLTEKYKDIVPSLSASLLPENQASVIGSKIADCLEALAVFDQLMNALDKVFSRSKTVYSKAIGDTIILLQLMMKEPVADSSHLAQLIQTITLQIDKSYDVHKILAAELSKVGRYKKDVNVEVRFWDSIQEVLQILVMKHLDIYESNVDNFSKPVTSKLFRFNVSDSFASQTTRLSTQPMSTICKPDAYNIVAIFRMLNGIGNSIQEKCGNKTNSSFNTFLHTFVMSTFIKRVSDDMETKTQTILSRPDVWTALSSTTHSVRLLTSCLSIFELCNSIVHLIINMEQYTQQFAQIWLDILRAYTANASDVYYNITRSRSSNDDDSGVEYRKISATWAADEDISRTLKSLPQWSLLNQASSQLASFEADVTPTGRMPGGIYENEKDARARTEREAEILIANLGKKKSIDKNELIFDDEKIRALICMHESLQWFTNKVRSIFSDLPKQASEILRTGSIVSQSGAEHKIKDAFQLELGRLEEISGTCLLIVYLELRVHCFYHLLPLAQNTTVQAHDDIDKGVSDFGREMVQFHKLLSNFLYPIEKSKVAYLFDGLGHLCASIFIHSSQHINKLTESNKKRIIRNIVAVQQHLCRITQRRENELDRAKTFFDLLNKNPDQLLALIMEQRAAFTFQEYTYLISLAVRSDPNQSNIPGALDKKIGQLRSMWKNH